MLKLMLMGMLILFGMTTLKAQNQRAVRSFELTINGPVEKVFPLFTPEGETLWIPSWKWTPIYPAGKETIRDMVFKTEEDTLWTLAVYEPPRRSVYVHTSPDVLARIEVECSTIDTKHTKMKITWVLTGITEHGKQVVEHHETEEHFTDRKVNWKKWLDEYAVKAGW